MTLKDNPLKVTQTFFSGPNETNLTLLTHTHTLAHTLTHTPPSTNFEPVLQSDRRLLFLFFFFYFLQCVVVTYRHIWLHLISNLTMFLTQRNPAGL